MKLLLLFSLLASGSLAIHDYVLNSANNNFTAFKVNGYLGIQSIRLNQMMFVLCRFTELTQLRNINQIFSTNWRLIPR